MHSIFLLKTVAQLSLILVIPGIFRYTFNINLAHFGTVALCVVALWISFLLRKNLASRLLPLLLLGILIPFAGVADLLFVIVPVTIFAIYIAIFDLYTIDNDAFRNVTTIAVIYIFITGYISMIMLGARLEFTAAALVCGILLSRNLRHDVATLEEPGYMVLNLSIIGLLLGTVVLVGTGILRRLIQMVLNGIAWLYFSLMGWPEAFDFGLIEMLECQYGWNEYEATTMEMEIGYREALAEATPPWLMLTGVAQAGFLLIMLLIVVLFGIWVARKLFMAHGKTKGSQNLQRENITITKDPKKRAIPDKPSSNSTVIRRYYQRFIKLINKQGARIQPRHTSQDMTSISQDFLGDRGNDLREVYIRARYSFDEITREDTYQARDAYRRLKDTKN